MRHRLIIAATLVSALSFGAAAPAGAQDVPPAPPVLTPATPTPPVPTGCDIYANHLKSQRDSMEAQLSNALAEIAALKKASPK